MAEEPHKLGVHHHKPGTVSPQVEERVEEAFLAAQKAAAHGVETEPSKKPSVPEQPAIVTAVPEITDVPVISKTPAPEAPQSGVETGLPTEPPAVQPPPARPAPVPAGQGTPAPEQKPIIEVPESEIDKAYKAEHIFDPDRAFEGVVQQAEATPLSSVSGVAEVNKREGLEVDAEERLGSIE